MRIDEAFKTINESGRESRRVWLSAAEELALVALRPFLGAIGGRIMMMLDEATKEKP
jgi:hypothetical protein